MHGLTSGTAAMHGFVRSAIMLSACTLAVALALMSFAVGSSEYNGPFGVMISAGFCLFSGIVAEAVSTFGFRASPFSGTVIGMIVRMFAPLGVCVAFLATGHDGRDHLHFFCYLLTFYMAMLALETWLAVKRAVPHAHSHRSQV
jgi:hypothetical protein